MEHPAASTRLSLDILVQELKAVKELLASLKAACESGQHPGHAEWLAVLDRLDCIKDAPAQPLRPAPAELVRAYVRTRTWLLEVYPMLCVDPGQPYALRQ